jgi:hypothetical protein
LPRFLPETFSSPTGYPHFLGTVLPPSEAPPPRLRTPREEILDHAPKTSIAPKQQLLSEIEKGSKKKGNLVVSKVMLCYAMLSSLKFKPTQRHPRLKTED